MSLLNEDCNENDPYDSSFAPIEDNDNEERRLIDNCSLLDDGEDQFKRSYWCNIGALSVMMITMMVIGLVCIVRVEGLAIDVKNVYFQISNAQVIGMTGVIIVSAMMMLGCFIWNDQEIRSLISRQLTYKFPIGIGFLILMVIAFYNKEFIYYGMTTLLGIGAISCFIWVYTDRISLKSIRNIICVQVGLSYMLAYIVLSTLISIFLMIEHYIQSQAQSMGLFLPFTSHFLLFLSSILMLTYLTSISYSFYITLTQISIYLSSLPSKYILTILILNSLCLIYSTISSLFKHEPIDPYIPDSDCNDSP